MRRFLGPRCVNGMGAPRVSGRSRIICGSDSFQTCPAVALPGHTWPADAFWSCPDARALTYGLGTAIGRLKGMAEKLLRDKQFALAVECSERALEVLTDNRDKFAALHTAFWSGGVFVYVPEGVHVELPLHVVYRLDTPGAAAHNRDTDRDSDWPAWGAWSADTSRCRTWASTEHSARRR